MMQKTVTKLTAELFEITILLNFFRNKTYTQALINRVRAYVTHSKS